MQSTFKIFDKPSFRLAAVIWLRGNLALTVLVSFALLFAGAWEMTIFIFPFAFVAAIGSLTIAVTIAIVLPFINRQWIDAVSRRMK